MQQLWKAGDRQVVIHDLGERGPDRGKEYPLRRLAEPRVLLRRLADDDRGIDRVLPHRQRRDVEDRERLGGRVVAGVVAERALLADLVLRDVALEHDLGARRHLDPDRDALDELDRLAAQEARHHELVDVLRERRARGVRGDRVEPERDGDLDPPVGREVVGTAVLVDLPVHERRVPVDDLHPVHADVAAAGLRVVGDHGRERDERRGVARPAALDREETEIDLVAAEDDLLADALADRLRPRVGDRLELLQPAHLLDQAFRRLHLEDVGELRGDVVEPLDAEGEAHPPLRAELVDQQRMLRTLRMLEEKGRPAGLDGAVDDLRDLEVGVHLGGDADELALALEQRDPVAEILEHAASLRPRQDLAEQTRTPASTRFAAASVDGVGGRASTQTSSSRPSDLISRWPIFTGNVPYRATSVRRMRRALGKKAERKAWDAAFVQSATTTITSPDAQWPCGSSSPHSRLLRPNRKFVSSSAGGCPGDGEGTQSDFQPR